MCYCLHCAKVREPVSCLDLTNVAKLVNHVFLCKFPATQERSCAQGFQSWEVVNATRPAMRNWQYIFPSLNFSCSGVITGWTLKGFIGNGSVAVGNVLALQLWKEEVGSESTYTLRTEQTHTASTINALSYVIEASPVMTVAAGDVFGVYVPARVGLRVAWVSDALHTVYREEGAPTNFSISSSGFNASPLIFIEFSESS